MAIESTDVCSEIKFNQGFFSDAGDALQVLSEWGYSVLLVGNSKTGYTVTVVKDGISGAGYGAFIEVACEFAHRHYHQTRTEFKRLKLIP